MNEQREVRLRPIPASMRHGKWQHVDIPIVKLGDVGKWSVVRRADLPQAMPFVVSRKDWDKYPAATLEQPE